MIGVDPRNLVAGRHPGREARPKIRERHHGLARLVIGSIADKVVRGSKTPVLIVHPQPDKIRARSQEVA